MNEEIDGDLDIRYEEIDSKREVLVSIAEILDSLRETERTIS